MTLAYDTEADITGLHNGQYQLDDNIIFGTRNPWIVPNKYLVQGFDVSEGSTSLGDTDFPNEDGTRFGVDFIGGMTITMDIGVRNKGQSAYDDVAAFKRAWKDKKYRQTSNAVTYLRMNKGGRTRRVYGRPRKFKETYGYIERGWAPITCDFQCGDDIFYDDLEQTHRIGLANPPTSGLTIPTPAPIAISQYASSYTNIFVDGDYPTWPIIKLKGPVVNPSIAYDNKWKMQLLLSLNFSETITIDTRPWIRTTTLDNGTNKSGFFTANSPVMREMQFEPGLHDLVYTGNDPSLTSRIDVNWRPAWSTP